MSVPITSPEGNAPPEPEVRTSSPTNICAPSARKVSFAVLFFMNEYSPTTMPEFPAAPTNAPTLMSTSISVLTVAQFVPSSVIWPTTAPYSVMTGSPISMPLVSPLLIVKDDDQFDDDQSTTLADSIS